MQKPNPVLAGTLVIGALLYSPYAVAQSSGSSGPGSTGSSAGGGTTTGIASDQAHISPPGTNSLGTANSSGTTGGGTVGVNREPGETRSIDTEIEHENSRIDSRINGICRGC
jgi:hypothetical protein